MKTRSLSTFLLLTFATSTFPFFSHAEIPSSQNHNHNQSELQNIDQQLTSLEKELSEMRRKAINREIHAQTYMIDNWHEFAEDINASEESEKSILAIKKKIKELTERKEALQKESSSK